MLLLQRDGRAWRLKGMWTIANRHPRDARFILTVTAALTAAIVAGCGSADPASLAHHSAHRHNSDRTPATSLTVRRRAPVGPLDATFVSRSMGWLLGQALAGRQQLALFRTVDGGRHWVALPAPPAPPQWQGHKEPADGVTSVTFADSRNGWLYGPGLWATHDGGATWNRIATHGAQVGSVQASGGQVLAAFSGCRGQCQPGQPRQPRFAVYRSAVGGDDWQRVDGASGQGSGGVVLTGVQVFRSANGGLSWHRLSLLYLEDGVGSLSITPAGVIIVAGMYNGMLISRDGGRTWHRVASVDNTDAVGGGGLIDVTTFGNRVGAAVVQEDRAWLTRDGGRVWIPVTIP